MDRVCRNYLGGSYFCAVKRRKISYSWVAHGIILFVPLSCGRIIQKETSLLISIHKIRIILNYSLTDGILETKIELQTGDEADTSAIACSKMRGRR